MNRKDLIDGLVAKTLKRDLLSRGVKDFLGDVIGFGSEYINFYLLGTKDLDQR